jgi:hypothetical protein
MTKDILVKKIKELKNKHPYNYNRTLEFRKIEPIIFEFTKKLDLDNPTLTERIYCLVHNFSEVPTCLECGGKVSYIRGSKYCSIKCSANSKTRAELIKKTCLDRYGVEHFSQLPEVKEKFNTTMLERYGVNHALQSKQILNKSEKTCLELYGNKHFTKSKRFALQKNIIKIKKKETNLKNKGVEHPLQNKNIFENKLKSSFKKKEFTFPSGRVEYVQGYEPHIIRELIDHFDEDDIICGSGLPEIWYMFDGKNHRYYPDIYIKSRNMIIEVKSDYTLISNLEVNLAKRQSCLDAGYKFWFTIGF